MYVNLHQISLCIQYLRLIAAFFVYIVYTIYVYGIHYTSIIHDTHHQKIAAMKSNEDAQIFVMVSECRYDFINIAYQFIITKVTDHDKYKAADSSCNNHRKRRMFAHISTNTTQTPQMHMFQRIDIHNTNMSAYKA